MEKGQHLLTVGFNVSSLVKVKIRLLVHVSNQILLRLRTRLRQYRRTSILVGAYRSDDSSDHVTILQRCSEWLQHDGEDPFASRVSIGAMIEAVAHAIRGEKVLVRQNLEDGRIQQKIGTSDDGLRQLAMWTTLTRTYLLTHDASPEARDLQAISTAERLLEQAVLIWMLGPRRSKYQLIRLGMMQETVPPVTAVRSTLSGSMAVSLEKSSSIEAEKTAVLEPLSFSTGMPARSRVSEGALVHQDGYDAHISQRHGMSSRGIIAALGPWPTLL